MLNLYWINWKLEKMNKIYFFHYRACCKGSWMEDQLWLEYQNPINLGIQVHHSSIYSLCLCKANRCIVSWRYEEFWYRSMKSFFKACGSFKLSMNFECRIWITLKTVIFLLHEKLSITFQTVRSVTWSPNSNLNVAYLL